ncbi:hypothetical protein [Vibrio diabolicus]|uniref:hypothetical protein n=1 Tax=Vibrio diabolicus TaxID=50719 RepID=UPI003752A312
MATTNTAAPRDTWGSKLGFVMAAAGSAVGLGNINRNHIKKFVSWVGEWVSKPVLVRV